MAEPSKLVHEHHFQDAVAADEPQDAAAAGRRLEGGESPQSLNELELASSHAHPASAESAQEDGVVNATSGRARKSNKQSMKVNYWSYRQTGIKSRPVKLIRHPVENIEHRILLTYSLGFAFKLVAILTGPVLVGLFSLLLLPAYLVRRFIHHIINHINSALVVRSTAAEQQREQAMRLSANCDITTQNNYINTDAADDFRSNGLRGKQHWRYAPLTYLESYWLKPALITTVVLNLEMSNGNKKQELDINVLRSLFSERILDNVAKYRRFSCSLVSYGIPGWRSYAWKFGGWSRDQNGASRQQAEAPSDSLQSCNLGATVERQSSERAAIKQNEQNQAANTGDVIIAPSSSIGEQAAAAAPPLLNGSTTMASQDDKDDDDHDLDDDDDDDHEIAPSHSITAPSETHHERGGRRRSSTGQHRAWSESAGSVSVSISSMASLSTPSSSDDDDDNLEPNLNQGRSGTLVDATRRDQASAGAATRPSKTKQQSAPKLSAPSRNDNNNNTDNDREHCTIAMAGPMLNEPPLERADNSDKFKLENHIFEDTLTSTTQLTNSLLRRHVHQLSSEELAWSRPLWQLRLVRGAPGQRRAAIIFRCQQSLADGKTLLKILAECLGPEQASNTCAPGEPSSKSGDLGPDQDSLNNNNLDDEATTQATMSPDRASELRKLANIAERRLEPLGESRSFVSRVNRSSGFRSAVLVGPLTMLLWLVWCFSRRKNNHLNKRLDNPSSCSSKIIDDDSTTTKKLQTVNGRLEKPQRNRSEQVGATRKDAAGPARLHWQSYSLTRFHQITQMTRSTCSDIILCALSGALRDYLRRQNGVNNPPNLDVSLSVDMGQSGPEQGNVRLSQVNVPLPVSIEGVVPRLWELRNTMDELRHSADPWVMLGFKRMLHPLLPTRLYQWLINKLTLRNSSILVNNLRGPRNAVESWCINLFQKAIEEAHQTPRIYCSSHEDELAKLNEAPELIEREQRQKEAQLEQLRAKVIKQGRQNRLQLCNAHLKSIYYIMEPPSKDIPLSFNCISYHDRLFVCAQSNSILVEDSRLLLQIFFQQLDQLANTIAKRRSLIAIVRRPTPADSNQAASCANEQQQHQQLAAQTVDNCWQQELDESMVNNDDGIDEEELLWRDVVASRARLQHEAALAFASSPRPATLGDEHDDDQEADERRCSYASASKDDLEARIGMAIKCSFCGHSVCICNRRKSLFNSHSEQLVTQQHPKRTSKTNTSQGQHQQKQQQHHHHHHQPGLISSLGAWLPAQLARLSSSSVSNSSSTSGSVSLAPVNKQQDNNIIDPGEQQLRGCHSSRADSASTTSEHCNDNYLTGKHELNSAGYITNDGIHLAAVDSSSISTIERNRLLQELDSNDADDDYAMTDNDEAEHSRQRAAFGQQQQQPSGQLAHHSFDKCISLAGSSSEHLDNTRCLEAGSQRAAIASGSRQTSSSVTFSSQPEISAKPKTGATTAANNKANNARSPNHLNIMNNNKQEAKSRRAYYSRSKTEQAKGSQDYDEDADGPSKSRAPIQQLVKQSSSAHSDYLAADFQPLEAEEDLQQCQQWCNQEKHQQQQTKTKLMQGKQQQQHQRRANFNHQDSANTTTTTGQLVSGHQHEMTAIGLSGRLSGDARSQRHKQQYTTKSNGNIYNQQQQHNGQASSSMNYNDDDGAGRQSGPASLSQLIINSSCTSSPAFDGPNTTTTTRSLQSLTQESNHNTQKTRSELHLEQSRSHVVVRATTKHAPEHHGLQTTSSSTGLHWLVGGNKNNLQSQLEQDNDHHNYYHSRQNLAKQHHHHQKSSPHKQQSWFTNMVPGRRHPKMRNLPASSSVVEVNRDDLTLAKATSQQRFGIRHKQQRASISFAPRPWSPSTAHLAKTTNSIHNKSDSNVNLLNDGSNVVEVVHHPTQKRGQIISNLRRQSLAALTGLPSELSRASVFIKDEINAEVSLRYSLINGLSIRGPTTSRSRRYSTAVGSVPSAATEHRRRGSLLPFGLMGHNQAIPKSFLDSEADV